jgi:hypothetical protein
MNLPWSIHNKWHKLYYISKFEIRISKFETIPNDQNFKILNQKRIRYYLKRLSIFCFEHLNLEFRYCFEFRI